MVDGKQSTKDSGWKTAYKGENVFKAPMSEVMHCG